jgi:hypothetical protein
MILWTYKPSLKLAIKLLLVFFRIAKIIEKKKHWKIWLRYFRKTHVWKSQDWKRQAWKWYWIVR